MIHSNNDEPLSNFLPGLGRPALGALAVAGYTHLAQLTQIKEADLRKLHGVGPKAVGILRSELEARGLVFADGER